MDGLSRLQGWNIFDGAPSPGMEEQGSMLTHVGSPSRSPHQDRQSPIGADGFSGEGQDLLRSFQTPSPIGSRSVGSGGPGSARSWQKQQQSLSGSPLYPSSSGVVLEPGGGLTNPGPGQFGRGPSPLEGRLGDVVSPPPRMDELSDMLAAASLSGMPVPPPMLMRPDPRTQLDFAAGPQPQGAWPGGGEGPAKGYKTVLCKFWENGACSKGANCTFAHGYNDIRRFPASVGLPPSPLKLDRYKTKLCLFHMQGRCCKGPACPYAHGLEELRPAPPGAAPAIPMAGPGGMGMGMGGMGGMGMGGIGGMGMGMGMGGVGAGGMGGMGMGIGMGMGMGGIGHGGAEWEGAMGMQGRGPVGMNMNGLAGPGEALAPGYGQSSAEDDHIPLLGGEAEGDGQDGAAGYGDGPGLGLGGGRGLMPRGIEGMTPHHQMLLAQKSAMASGSGMVGPGGNLNGGYRPVGTGMWPHGPAPQWGGGEV